MIFLHTINLNKPKMSNSKFFSVIKKNTLLGVLNMKNCIYNIKKQYYHDTITKSDFYKPYLKIIKNNLKSDKWCGNTANLKGFLHYQKLLPIRCTSNKIVDFICHSHIVNLKDRKLIIEIFDDIIIYNGINKELFPEAFYQEIYMDYLEALDYIKLFDIEAGDSHNVYWDLYNENILKIFKVFNIELNNEIKNSLKEFIKVTPFFREGISSFNYITDFFCYNNTIFSVTTLSTIFIKIIKSFFEDSNMLLTTFDVNLQTTNFILDYPDFIVHDNDKKLYFEMFKDYTKCINILIKLTKNR